MIRTVLTSAAFVAITVAPALASAQQVQQQNQIVEARKLSDAFVQVAERVSPSVVQIDVTQRDQSNDLMRMIGEATPIARGTGSGVVFTPDGAILTNNHVVDGALTINVHLRDGRFLPATLVGRDPAADLAVIKVSAQGLVAARFGDSDNARVGEMVVAIGSPFGLGYTVTTGVLSAKGRGGLGVNAIEDYLQTDASINPGNSGGPLCNLDGQVLGINTMIVGRGSGIGFAVPSSLARRVAEQLLKTGKVERAWVGVGTQDLNPDLAAALHVDARAGALVNSVGPGTPAERAHLKPGDLIASVGGKAVHDSHELAREVLTHDVNQTVTLEVIREGHHYATQITLAARPEQAIPPIPAQQQNTAPQGGLGLTIRDLTPQQAASIGLPAKPIAVVASVTPGSSADRAGVKSGDVIVEADGVASPSVAQV
ncbi:MAG TPA: trypsin-like peptidase domain-containing protein, partial [Polyangiaceae bacterium]|nr:trypsin-like peptidase domain-containing protein [Polyangiaceae bacterium]